MLMLLALLAADHQPAPAAAPPKEKKVCRSEADIGSIVPRRTCHTPAEWKQLGEAQAAQSRAELRNLNATPGQNPQ